MSVQTGDIAVKNKLESEQLFKISRFKEVIKRTRPHKHDAYFELIYLSEGAGFHWADTQKFQITPPIIFFLLWSVALLGNDIDAQRLRYAVGEQIGELQKIVLVNN